MLGRFSAWDQSKWPPGQNKNKMAAGYVVFCTQTRNLVLNTNINLKFENVRKI